MKAVVGAELVDHFTKFTDTLLPGDAEPNADHGSHSGPPGLLGKDRGGKEGVVNIKDGYAYPGPVEIHNFGFSTIFSYV